MGNREADPPSRSMLLTPSASALAGFCLCHFQLISCLTASNRSEHQWMSTVIGIIVHSYCTVTLIISLYINLLFFPYTIIGFHSSHCFLVCLLVCFLHFRPASHSSCCNQVWRSLWQTLIVTFLKESATPSKSTRYLRMSTLPFGFKCFVCFIWANCSNLGVGCCFPPQKHNWLVRAYKHIHISTPRVLRLPTCQTDTAESGTETNVLTKLSASARIPQKIISRHAEGKVGKVSQHWDWGVGVPSTFPLVNFWSRDRWKPRYWFTSISLAAGNLIKLLLSWFN